jgi:hypothetical protein
MVLMKAWRDCSVPEGDTANLVGTAIALDYEEVPLDEQRANTLGLRDTDLGDIVEPQFIRIDVCYP